MNEARDRAADEIRFCEAILAKSGTNVLLETLRDAPDIEAWSHYPEGDIYDPASSAQYYYHCHDPSGDAAEHGHFHCFVRPDGRGGPIHHLAAIGVDPYGRLLRIFTVNHWVVGDTWRDADATIPLLEKFDLQMARPSYLVNRWLTAIFVRYEDEIVRLIRERDAVIAAHGEGDVLRNREDRTLEVTSEFRPLAGQG
jgi:hypothetical protein